MKKHTKEKTKISEKKSSDSFTIAESSPYRLWMENRGSQGQEYDIPEIPEANPDVLPESKGLYYSAPVEDDRLELIKCIEATLTEKQREILRLCGYEGRTVANCSLILGISRGAVQTVLKRIREKVSVLQKRHIQPIE